MGDGGVACVPSQHVMERFPLSDTFCGGNGGFNSRSLQYAESQLQRKHEKKMEVENEEFSSEKGRKFERGKKGDVEKGEIASEKLPKEEVEEGELGSLLGAKGQVENGEFVPEKSQRREIENGEFVPDKCRKGGEVEKGEFVPEKWRKAEVENGELLTGRARREVEKGEFIIEKGRRGEVEKSDLGRGRRGELEKGEFVPDKWRKSEVVKEDYASAKGRKWEMEKDDNAMDRGWKYERDRTPPSMKFSDEDASQRRELSRSGSERRKRSSSSRWYHDHGHDMDSKTNLRIVDEELGSYKHEYSDGKNHGRERASGTWRKRYCTESEGSSRKYHGEDYPGFKSRRVSDDSNRAGHEKHYSRGLQESSYRNSSSSSSSRLPISSRFSSRHYDSSSSSRVVHDRHGRSPARPERSPRDRGWHHDHRDRSPGHSEWSPHDRRRVHDHKNRSPVHVERSPRDRSRHHDQRDDCREDLRDRTPGYQERLPRDRGRPLDYQESSRKSGGSERQHSWYANQGNEEKLGHRESAERDSHKHLSTSQTPNSSTVRSSGSGSADKNITVQGHKDEESQNVSLDSKETPLQVNEAPEELLSMEEDMDISDTPPHVPVMSDSNVGKWFYLDHSGIEKGPSKLCDLKRLVEEGFMLSDHLIKHSESERWVTVENAVSPLVPVNFPSVVSDAITQLVSPPEAPGNLLADVANAGQPVDQKGEELPASSLQPLSQLHGISSPLEPLEYLYIDERVRALLSGYTVITGKELETLGEALQMTFEHADWENWGSSEGFTRFQPSTGYSTQRRDENFDRSLDAMSKEAIDTRSADAFASADCNDWFSNRWSCKGGDWKRNDEASQDRSSKKKLVLNDGYALCQLPKSGCEDPRWHRKDELYYPSQSRRLDLPPWAFSWPEEKNPGQIKPLNARGLKGTMLSVVRINACVVKDHGSFISEPRMRIRGNERHSSRSHRSVSGSTDGKSVSAEGASQSRKHTEQNLQGLLKSVTPINTPKDHVCTVDELQLHLGDWYYFDGAGHEHGPLSFSKLQALVDKGTLPKSTSVFRKDDNIWVPVVSAANASDAAPATDSSVAQSQVAAQSGDNIASSSFHSLHPQFIGYTRGKLHELVMKSYKSREFAAAVNEVLEPWINAKQPKKELDKHPFTSAVTKSYFSQNFATYKFQKSEDETSFRAGKRARMVVNESGEDDEVEDLLIEHEDGSFEELCGDTVFDEGNGASAEIDRDTWGLLNGSILARVFHFLRTDLKSLAFSAATCKRWNAAVRSYRDISRQINFSSAGPMCTDSMFQGIMDGYKKEKITSIILVGCTNISAGVLDQILHLFPCISSVDIRGCSQFSELTEKFPNLNWIKSRVSSDARNLEETCSKMRSLSQITEKSFSVSKAFKGSNSHLDESNEPGDSLDHDVTMCRRDSVSQSFRQSYYSRTKLRDVKMPRSLLSRDAQLRWLLRKKSENVYKKMEEFLALSLRDIMKENTFDFFVPKVAEIEDRMKNGYYIGHGLNSVKEDISRMCRDAIKARNRGDAGDMNHIIMLFIRLARSLDENSKSCHERNEMMKLFKDNARAGFCSVASKYGKKLNKVVNERKIMRNGTSYVNGGINYRECASDREIRRRLSKLNKRDLDSGSETSGDPDQCSEVSSGDGNCSSSDTESDLGFQSEGGTGDLTGDRYFGADESLDSIADDREWGARMTKASLVPPVTRKYEVIDRYVIVADEEEVQRKMRVCLPEDYSEKLKAQKNITEESDMEIPEVKDYKPRKQLGNEVLEQEVYGIDPYTHNLLLDSMPDDLDWTLPDKHMFVEDVLLRVLNKQVRSFTGTGNTPMMYPLQRVVEEILKTAQERGDKRIMKICQCILKSMEDRREDNYVAYRKGLGVVCNSEEGFGEDDFVVEFLGEVYPAWKWFEKQDGIRLLQKNNNDPAPEFYNIYLERPKGDRDGYDLVVVDAMHKANYASRICHSCRPNCEAKVTAVDGRYLIGVYTVRPINYGEEITFDYNSVTESKEEYEASVCLCGSQVCRGSYLNLTGEGAFQKILKESHGMLDRHRLMLEACELNFVSEDDYLDLGRAGLGACLLYGLPDWLIAYSARLVRFINFERTKLPEEILTHNLEEKRKFFLDICLDTEKSDAEVQAEGVYNQRLQNLAVTLDKVRYVMRSIFGDSKKAPPPLEKLSPEEVVSVLWKGEGSLVEELLQCMAPHVEENLLNDLKSKIDVHDPSGSDDLRSELKKSLLWLRDEVRNLPCTYKCRHDAAADLIHIYAHTKCFFRVREYKTLTSPPVYISPLDLGPKYTDKLGSGFQEYRKTYGENYCLGQLIYWHIQNNADPDCQLGRARRGCLFLPDIASLYAKAQRPSMRQRVYGQKTLRFMVSIMEKQPQRPWPKDKIWSFEGAPRVFGSPMLDAVLKKSPLDKEMLHWLKSRPAVFQAMWDQ
ncbi:histone-lysine N-methyltransferase ATXR3-like [Macadamia integrifolia]|uniref:histone-lysine N-methyltransferase ATXR3-like n=1 Tax=Macadamia integrifolia TaxID=60698 RepID=UPI001C4E93F9|nr:histone-lysine N-methyltransferase ATXR3-like [Macadamia integrifolia]XP_042517529.1 histone-lysine N-methyltransferase ATXR3-like [Macadamia integrifolia]